MYFRRFYFFFPNLPIISFAFLLIEILIFFYVHHSSQTPIQAKTFLSSLKLSTIFAPYIKKQSFEGEGEP